MDLNNIELPELLITELYRNTLIAPDSTPAGTPAVARPTSATPVPPASAIPQAHPPFIYTADPRTAAAASPSGSSKPATAIAPQAGTATSLQTPASGPYKFLGANQKKITVLVHSAGIAFLPDDQLNILTRMLEACKMNLADIAMVNHATIPVNIVSLKEQLAPRIILLFGIEPVAIQLPINFPQFKIQPYDQCTYLYAPSLDQMTAPTDASKAIKSKLWTCLKTLFSV